MSERETTYPHGPMSGRTIALCVTGSIAAYKAVEVCRLLVDAGAHVIPVLTSEATRFVGAVTFSALASEPVQTSLWDEDSPIPHTRLGQTAEAIRALVVKPLPDEVPVFFTIDSDAPTLGESPAQFVEEHANEFVRNIGLSPPCGRA